MDILVRCSVNPTEDLQKVEQAIKNIIGPHEILYEEYKEISELVFSDSKKDSLGFVRQSIHDERIIDVARKRLLSNWNGTSTQIHFDKQTAFIGKLRVIDDSETLPPLGTIEIVLVFNDESQFEEFLHWFTPPTKNGRIIA
ncbi:MAG: RNA-binding domain-containing protein [Candidatus Thorarchaeota archaeon]